MIVAFVIAAGVLVFVGSFVWDHIRRRRIRDLASRGSHGPTQVDGVASSAAAEALLRSGYRGSDWNGVS